MRIPKSEQFEGCLIGLCLGDALGFAVEGYPALICKRYAQEILKTGKAGQWVHYPYSFAQYSDDAQLARELMRSYVNCLRFDPLDYARRMTELYQRNELIGVGKNTERAIQQLMNGVPWTQSGTLPPSAGNGSAMRAAPLGLFFFNEPEKLIESAWQQSQITHRDPRCGAGATIIARAVALALQTEHVVPDEFLDALIPSIQTQTPEFAQFLSDLKYWISLPPEVAVMSISQAGMDNGYENIWPGISPFVIGSVLWSLYAFLKSPEDYWETICTAIAAGGDTDTTAAMAGAISGAYLGLHSISADLARQLTDQGRWTLPELLKLANQCYLVKFAPQPVG